MKKMSVTQCLLIMLFAVCLVSCRKDGMHSAMAKRIQHKWQRISSSSRIVYSDIPATPWVVIPGQPDSYLDFHDNGYFYSNTTKFQYKVDGDKILSILAGVDRFTTPQYTDTIFIKEVNDHLLVLSNPSYYGSTGYSYVTERLDSLKR